MRTDRPSFEVALWVYGAQPPDALRAAVRVWAAGDRRTYGGKRFEEPGWCLTPVTSADATVEEHVRAIVRALDPVAAEFAGRPASVKAEIACALYLTATESTPSLHLSSDTITSLGGLRVSVDVDLYVVDAMGNELEPTS